MSFIEIQDYYNRKMTNKT